jgi:hypothetical protein
MAITARGKLAYLNPQRLTSRVVSTMQDRQFSAHSRGNLTIRALSYGALGPSFRMEARGEQTNVKLGPAYHAICSLASASCEEHVQGSSWASRLSPFTSGILHASCKLPSHLAEMLVNDSATAAPAPLDDSPRGVILASGEIVSTAYTDKA